MDKRRKILLVVFIALAVIAITASTYTYQIFYSSNVDIKEAKTYELFISEDDDINSISTTLNEEGGLVDYVSFRFVSKLLKYNENIKEGRYLVKKGMTNLELVRMLRAGNQSPVKITFNNCRTKEDIAEKLSKELSLSKEELLFSLNDSSLLNELGYDSISILSAFIPNTYEVYWNISGEALLKRMKYEHDQFWNKTRLQKAEEVGLSPYEVSVLASIVQAETIKKDEKPKVAGLYINRLKRGMRLQSDPTVVYAVGDFDIRRVLTKHLQVDSPYNTYKYKGLPPGPINLPEISSIDAVLNYEKHRYIFMCAKEDFSGYHNFAINSSQHSVNAAKYRRALNRKRIYR
ncbi:endolytic transglycosylase MltG [Sediminitomix flava]|uniref:Endolytic murein transglycosylase n=1 Tax=Sediminitomix flava TaxID=379075 RepID=A0A315Z7F3_SEDFL|nr:endolytic transglycosylase MltG [Sediminitomix flava]PWJ40074.1 UPF0755 protein [Sediminitomix flava]